MCTLRVAAQHTARPLPNLFTKKTPAAHRRAARVRVKLGAQRGTHTHTDHTPHNARTVDLTLTFLMGAMAGVWAVCYKKQGAQRKGTVCSGWGCVTGRVRPMHESLGGWEGVCVRNGVRGAALDGYVAFWKSRVCSIAKTRTEQQIHTRARQAHTRTTLL